MSHAHSLLQPLPLDEKSPAPALSKSDSDNYANETQSLNCVICLELPEDPVITNARDPAKQTNCHTYCSKCINLHLAQHPNNPTDPKSRTPLSRHQPYKKNRWAEEAVNTLKKLHATFKLQLQSTQSEKEKLELELKQKQSQIDETHKTVAEVRAHLHSSVNNGKELAAARDTISQLKHELASAQLKAPSSQYKPDELNQKLVESQKENKEIQTKLTATLDIFIETQKQLIIAQNNLRETEHKLSESKEAEKALKSQQKDIYLVETQAIQTQQRLQSELTSRINTEALLQKKLVDMTKQYLNLEKIANETNQKYLLLLQEQEELHHQSQGLQARLTQTQADNTYLTQQLSAHKAHAQTFSTAYTIALQEIQTLVTDSKQTTEAYVSLTNQVAQLRAEIESLHKQYNHSLSTETSDAKKPKQADASLPAINHNATSTRSATHVSLNAARRYSLSMMPHPPMPQLSWQAEAKSAVDIFLSNKTPEDSQTLMRLKRNSSTVTFQKPNVSKQNSMAPKTFTPEEKRLEILRESLLTLSNKLDNPSREELSLWVKKELTNKLSPILIQILSNEILKKAGKKNTL